MSEAAPPAEWLAARERTLSLYAAVTVLMLIGLAILIVYTVVLVGPLTSPGAQQSFGIALALAFLMAALVSHFVDRMYRVWPMGRRIAPPTPPPITTSTWVRAFRWLVVAIVAAAIAYLLGALIAG